jgi:hypothetical protein
MRNLLTGFMLSVALGTTAPLLADNPASSSFDKEPAPAVSRLPDSVGQSSYEKDSLSSSNRPMTLAQQRIFERATIEGRERLARMEIRHRDGVSIQRPSVYVGGVIMPNTFWMGNWHYRVAP